jgi:hypothetical protein
MKTFKEYILENEEQEENNGIFYPGGVYISVKLSEETEKAVNEYQEKYLKGQKINEELHCTLIYSKKPYVDEIEAMEYTAVGTFKEFNLFGPEEDTLVVEINSQDLTRRNTELVEEYRFISDFGEYKSHVTLSYDIENIDLNSLPPMDFAFTFINEAVEPLKLNWNGTGDNSDNEESGTLAGKALKKMKDNEEENKSSDKSDDKDKKD